MTMRRQSADCNYMQITINLPLSGSRLSLACLLKVLLSDYVSVGPQSDGGVLPQLDKFSTPPSPRYRRNSKHQ